jgi:hypothetical protein
VGRARQHLLVSRGSQSQDRSANGTSASVGRAGRITRSTIRNWSGWMRPDRGGAEVLPVHAQGRICIIGADRPWNRSSRGPSAPWYGMPSEAVDVDHGQLVYPSLKDCPLKVDLHEFSPVGGWPAGGRHGRRLERFAQVCQGLTSRGRSHPGLLPLANLRFEVSRLLPAVSSEPDVAAAPKGTPEETPPPPGP